MRSPSTSSTTTPKSKPKPKSKFESSAVSQIQNAAENQPPPLRICLPQFSPSLRRSPRFITPLQLAASSPSAVKLATVSSAKARRLTHANYLRQSPRLNSAPAVGEPRVRKGKLKLKTWEELPLRRSPRFWASAVTIPRHSVKWQRTRGPELTLNADLRDPKCVPEKSLRRSPRFASTHSECERICTSSQMLGSLAKDNLEIALNNSSNICLEAKPGLLSFEKGTRPFKHPKAKFSCEKQLRLSPRLNQSRNRASETCVEQLDVKLSDVLKFRRSPRFSSSIENKNLEVVVQERRTPKVESQQKKNTKIELFDSLVEQHYKVKTRSTNLNPRGDGTKCLSLSSEAITSPSWVEEVKTNFDSTAMPELEDNQPRKKHKTFASLTNESMDQESISSFIGDPILDDEAHKRWGWRYELKEKKCKDKKFKINEDEEDEIIVNVKCHYAQAKIGNHIFSLGDCALIKGEEEENHVGKIIEFFQTTNNQSYFRVRWFYRIQDTVVQNEGDFHDKRRLFYSSIMNDNLIDCIVAKANVTHTTPRIGLKLTSASPSDFYYDMEYCVDYSTFHNMPSEASSITKSLPNSESHETELALLDLYSGCGGMSTGLCLGAKVSSVNLVTRWAVDSDKSASESLKLNHPDTHVINESAEDFLELLKEWEKLCKRYKVNDAERSLPLRSKISEGSEEEVDCKDHNIPDGEFEVSRFVDVCYGDPSETGKRGLYMKVRWMGYGASEDTWERIESLSKCKESIQHFVRKGMKSKILPLPGEVDVLCGGPPCQGVSGYNRFRNTISPFEDERNRQVVVFMDIVKFLKPKYVLMENVVDILRVNKGSVGRYALSRLVHMNYQARMGIIAAACYGLPQFRLRVFFWGAYASEVLPQFPLPTHDVIVKYWPPMEFERNVVAYDEDQPRNVEKAVVIQDAISDLPAVTNNEAREEMSYENPPGTELQRYIRSTKYEMTGLTLNGTIENRSLLNDHRPHFLFEDDYLRVCQIPKRKGANFRDLPGVVVGDDNVVRRHPTEKPLLPSGKPLVPDYAFTYEQGKSKRPFARLWWDETVPTALTSPSCHHQAILHPEQDRVLTIREFARLQGFPDYYRFCGTVKERYCQIGNAVAVPVARALGYALGIAHRKLSGNEPLMILPPKFSHSNYLQLLNNHADNTD